MAMRAILLLAIANLTINPIPTMMTWSAVVESGKQPEIGTDFLSFYTASKMALAGHSLDVYNQVLHKAAQKLIFPGLEGHFAFFYPPIFLLLCLPLALLPYYAALTGWLAASALACFVALARWAPMSMGERLLALIAFPAFTMNVFHGQNAFLTTALMAGGIMALERRPLLAGALFGALVFKPQFGLLIPLLLIVTGNWRAILAAGASAVAFILASLAIFGAEVWRAYFVIMPQAHAALNENFIGNEKMQSVFAMLRIVGASVNAAYIAQAIVSAAVCVTLIYVSRRTNSTRSLGALMVTGVMLCTPFMLRYDLMLLAIPLLWLAGEGARTGLLRGEKQIASLAFLLPLVPVAIAQAFYILLAPLVIGALFITQARRILRS